MTQNEKLYSKDFSKLLLSENVCKLNYYGLTNYKINNKTICRINLNVYKYMFKTYYMKQFQPYDYILILNMYNFYKYLGQ